MFDWKILFRMPQLAHVALPRRSCVCVMLCAFATDAILVVAFPLTRREGCCRLAFCTGCAPTFFAIFGQQRMPVGRIPSKMPQKKVSAQTNSFLERSRVKRSKNQQLFASCDASDRDIHCEGISCGTYTKIRHHSVLDGLSLCHMRGDGELGRERELRARNTQLGALSLPV